MTDRYINSEGLVGVMVSPGFGAGFHTWNDIPDLCFDKDIITMILEDKPYLEISDFTEAKYEKSDKGFVSTIGLASIEIVWLEPGTRFLFEEYDGSESIILLENNPSVLTA